MADPRDLSISAHIKSISTRAEWDTERLVAGMLGVCWPGGPGDHLEPGAIEWVRRWGPQRLGAMPSACSCRAGRCRICN